MIAQHTIPSRDLRRGKGFDFPCLTSMRLRCPAQEKASPDTICKRPVENIFPNWRILRLHAVRKVPYQLKSSDLLDRHWMFGLEPPGRQLGYRNGAGAIGIRAGAMALLSGSSRKRRDHAISYTVNF